MSATNGHAKKNGQHVSTVPKPRYREDDDEKYDLRRDGRIGEELCGEPEAAPAAAAAPAVAPAAAGELDESEPSPEPEPEPAPKPGETQAEYDARIDAWRADQQAREADEIVEPPGTLSSAEVQAREEAKKAKELLQGERYELATGQTQPSDCLAHTPEEAERAIRVGRVLLEQLHDPDLDSDDVTVANQAEDRRRRLLHEAWDATAKWLANAGELTAAELAAKEIKIEYLIDELLAAGEHTIVAGPSKLLKTSLVADMTVALVTGSRWLGRQVLRPCRVGLCSVESGPLNLREMLRRSCREKRIKGGLDSLGDRLIVITDKMFRSDDPQSLSALARWIVERRLDVVVLDPAYLMMPGDNTGIVNTMGQRLNQFGEICRRLGVTLIILHHSVKGAARVHEPMALEDITGSGFAEWAAQWFLLSRRETYDPNVPQHKLWLAYGARVGHQGLVGLDVDESPEPDGYTRPVPRRLLVKVRDAEECRQEQRQRKAQAAAEGKLAKTGGWDSVYTQRLHEAMVSLGGQEPVGVRQLRDQSKKLTGKEMNGSNARDALGRLLASGRFTLVRQGDQELYRLAQQSDEMPLDEAKPA